MIRVLLIPIDQLIKRGFWLPNAKLWLKAGDVGVLVEAMLCRN